jgi:hypothetical protein
VIYLRLRITTHSPSGRVWASRLQTSLFNSRCLHSASKILVLHSLRRQTPCAPRSKFVSNCLYPEGFPVLRLLVLFYHDLLHFFSCPQVICLPAALLHNSFTGFCPDLISSVAPRSIDQFSLTKVRVYGFKSSSSP